MPSGQRCLSPRLRHLASPGTPDRAPNSQKLSVLETSREFASHQPAPTWLSVDHANLSGKVLSLPKREDVQLPVNEQLIVELYSK
jgi:small subunit ribosomal protein S4